MSLEEKNEQGRITINETVVARIAGAAAMEVFGLVGMSSRQQLKDGFSELLGRENLTRGIEVRTENGEVDVDLHIIVSYGTKISEVAHNVQQRVKYTLNEIAGITANRINIFIQGVRV